MGVKNRIEYVVTASGQPRAYADSQYVVQVFFSHVPYTSKSGAFEVELVTEERARKVMEAIPGFISTTKAEQVGWWDSYLDYVRPICPTIKKTLTDDVQVASTWEFRTVSPFTD